MSQYQTNNKLANSPLTTVTKSSEDSTTCINTETTSTTTTTTNTACAATNGNINETSIIEDGSSSVSKADDIEMDVKKEQTESNENKQSIDNISIKDSAIIEDVGKLEKPSNNEVIETNNDMLVKCKCIY